MDWDELKPKPPKGPSRVGEDLKTLSVAELKARIVALTAEIERVKAESCRPRRRTRPPPPRCSSAEPRASAHGSTVSGAPLHVFLSINVHIIAYPVLWI